ncbi:alpha/beta fold hydrolase [Sabulicella glaciei]|uniref:Alpha/beta fold hydrolase n=1 Tax=Sabulicella glaciei TaxID=2984948 RepID=A0ABT3NQ47_9PROT|nr:alpha/beta fold hydrolase [Roseococcus sp. MDT2-1-1]MCW8084286.1 alpha/beta fold hydrolase [Roseococcus sp. MDT2-1-1]
MRLLFGDGCVLDAARRELRREGKTIPIEPQVFDLLFHLLSHRDRVVSRDEMLEAVWGGRIVSESTIASRIGAARRAIGDSGEAQRLIRTLARRGVRFVGEASEVAGEGAPDAFPSQGADISLSVRAAPALRQDVTFLSAADGVSLAIASAGEGPAVLVKTANWLNHLEHDWRSPVWFPLLNRLASGRRLVRYDGRGHGLSDREVADISLSAFVRDLETVVEGLGLERFALFGISQGGAVAIAYAAAHPERVSRIVLHCAFAQGRGRRGTEAERELARAFQALIRQGWGDEHSAFVRAFASVYFPAATPEQMRAWIELQRLTTSAETAVRIRTACDEIDVTELLGQVRAPTLVLHSRHDNLAPLDQGRRIAAGIPGARFVELESENHVILEGEPAWPRLLEEIERFLAPMQC